MIVFSNPGILDMRGLTTFGLTSKSGQSKLGRFGTGLKYSTAVIIRAGGKITISAGGETYEIGKTTDTFRGNEITQLKMNDSVLPFTTDLGKDWEIWQAFRELYSNALDEGGDVFHSEKVAETVGDETKISIELPAFEAIYYTMEEHFIGKQEAPIYASESMEVYRGKSLFIFYQGIAIHKLKEPTAFRYNLKGYVDLTEDRTAKYDWQIKGTIALCLTKTDNGEVALAAADQRNTFEASLDFSNSEASKVFLGAAVELGKNCNPTAMALVRAQLAVDTNQYTVYSKADPGAETFANAMVVLRNTGADLSKAVFVLASGVSFYYDYEIRNGKIFINEKIFKNQEKMNVAVIEAYSTIVGGHWMAKQLIENAKVK